MDIMIFVYVQCKQELYSQESLMVPLLVAHSHHKTTHIRFGREWLVDTGNCSLPEWNRFGREWLVDTRNCSLPEWNRLGREWPQDTGMLCSTA